MEWHRRAAGAPRRLGVLPGAFTPPTVAHFALAHAAWSQVDQVLLVLPLAFPHKTYTGASRADRIDLLVRVCAGDPGLSI